MTIIYKDPINHEIKNSNRLNLKTLVCESCYTIWENNLGNKTEVVIIIGLGHVLLFELNHVLSCVAIGSHITFQFEIW